MTFLLWPLLPTGRARCVVAAGASSKKRSQSAPIAVCIVDSLWTGMKTLLETSWLWPCDGSKHKAVPSGRRKQVHLGVYEKPLDRRPLPPLSNEGTASPLDERGTPAHLCRGVSATIQMRFNEPPAGSLRQLCSNINSKGIIPVS